jgi:transglutaminase-like putative cysteine protease
MARTLAACALPALAISIAWVRIEDPTVAGDVVAAVALALAPAVVPWVWARWLASAAAAAAVVWLAFGTRSWELLPGRDERVLTPLAESIRKGVGDFYRVLLPFDPVATPEMHGLVLLAVFGFVLAVSLLVAARRPVAAAAVTVVGTGWPATLLGGDAVQLGALALGAALSIPLVMRVRTARALLAGAVAAGLVVVGAAWASSATTIARESALDWESWDLYGSPHEASGVQFAWNSNYDGIEFPRKETVVLTIEGPKRAQYWKTSTLDFFTDDHWFESLIWLGAIRKEGIVPVPGDRLTPKRARTRANWLEQEVEVKALVDDRLAAAGTPTAIDTRRIGTVYPLQGSVLRAREPLGEGERYRIWSYAPDPAPAALARSRPRYPQDALAYLEIGSRQFPRFGTGSYARAAEMLRNPSYRDYWPYARVLAVAHRVTRRARTPYAAVLALESWFRQRGGFRYDEQPPPSIGPPLVDFVTRTKAGYCQHYAGAMTLMLRMLGIPSRVAVGFTSGTWDEDRWVVTDHDAHAWVEVWFAGQGWVAFDPTPGRGTFGGQYSFASDSAQAVAALGRGELGRRPFRDVDLPDAADLPLTATANDRRAPSLFAFVLGLSALWVACVGLGKTAIRRARYLSRDPRRKATASRKELEAYLRDQGIAIPPGATLEDLRRTVGEELGVDALAFAQAAGRARFGRTADAGHEAERARTELRALLRRARSELSLWDRLRGLVSLRSLRTGWER